MAKKTVSKIENQVRTITNAAAVEIATSIRAVTLLMDKAIVEVDKKKETLYLLLKGEFKAGMLEDGAVIGNFQIPVDDEGDIVEVPLSCTPEPLNSVELQALGFLPAPIFSAIFEECCEIESITDLSALMHSLSSHTALAKMAAVKNGKVVISSNDTTLQGVSLVTNWYAKTNFVARAHQAFANTDHTDQQVTVFVDWFIDRMRLAVKVGNRASTTTT